MVSTMKVWKSWRFYECVALEILFLRLATGSGYSNSRSLAPVMTPDFGSWQSWYQSLGLEMYDLGCLIVIDYVFFNYCSKD